MIELDLRTSLQIIHVVGVAFGVGGATACDFLFLRAIQRNAINFSEYLLIHAITRLVTVGLILTILSGIGFLINYQINDPKLLANEKVWAKVTIVAVLTLNGALLHAYILPIMRSRVGTALINKEMFGTRHIFILAGVISGISWYAAVVLGLWRQLNFKVSYGEVMIAYAAVLALGFAACVPVMSWLMRRSSYKRSNLDHASGSLFHDSLTGIANQRYFDDHLLREENRATRYGEDFAVLYLDLNDFHALNERYGTYAGDAVLKAVAHKIAKLFRSPDIVARYGGDEIAVLLPCTDSSGAELSAERVRRMLAQNRFDVSEETGLARANCIAITAAVGVATFSLSRLVGRPVVELACEAAWTAKVTGGNMIAMAMPEASLPASA